MLTGSSLLAVRCVSRVGNVPYSLYRDTLRPMLLLETSDEQGRHLRVVPKVAKVGR